MTGNSNNQIAQMFGLSGKVALVTGGAVGMGKASGLVLAAAGATVILADDPDRVSALDRHGLPAGMEVIALDVRSESEVAKGVSGIVSRHGGIDILVHGAVTNFNKKLLEITGEEWDQVQATNLRSGLFMAKAVIPSMQARGGGRIISISTMGSIQPVLNGNSAYGSSRAGLNHLMRNIALDFAADHITANSVLPGAIITETIASNFKATGPGADPSRHLGGYGKPDDVTGLILLLAGPAGRYITGQAVAVDGGFLVS